MEKSKLQKTLETAGRAALIGAAMTAQGCDMPEPQPWQPPVVTPPPPPPPPPVRSYAAIEAEIRMILNNAIRNYSSNIFHQANNPNQPQRNNELHQQSRWSNHMNQRLSSINHRDRGFFADFTLSGPAVTGTNAWPGVGLRPKETLTINDIQVWSANRPRPDHVPEISDHRYIPDRYSLENQYLAPYPHNPGVNQHRRRTPIQITRQIPPPGQANMPPFMIGKNNNCYKERD